MKAVVQDVYGSADVLELRDIDRPPVGEGEVLVQVRAAGVDPGVWHLMAGEPYLVRVVLGGARLAVVAAPGGSAGGELELAALVGEEGGPGEGVVLVFGDQVPGQDGHLAGGGYDGGLGAAAGFDALIEGAQRARGVAGRPGGTRVRCAKAGTITGP